MRLIVILTDYSVEGLMSGERRLEKVMGRFSRGLVCVSCAPTLWKFSERTEKSDENSEFGNPLSSPRFELPTTGKQFYMVTAVPT
jgi:hypothetical protein